MLPVVALSRSLAVSASRPRGCMKLLTGLGSEKLAQDALEISGEGSARRRHEDDGEVAVANQIQVSLVHFRLAEIEFRYLDFSLATRVMCTSHVRVAASLTEPWTLFALSLPER